MTVPSHECTGELNDARTKPNTPSVRLQAVSKQFGSFWAVRNVSLEIAPGSIHAVIGENGAGKTTLMRVLYGLYPPDGGTIELAGKPLYLKGPAEALVAGISMVHQQSLLLTGLTVAENVLLSYRDRGLVRHRRIEEALAQLAEETSIPLDPRAKVERLSVAARQRAELLIALYHQATVIILDEPTTILTPQEVDRLFETLQLLRDAGRTMLFVTHKLNEVMAITDSVTVMRRGQVNLSCATRDTSIEELTTAILGLEDARADPSSLGDDQEDALAVLGTGLTRPEKAAPSAPRADMLCVEGLTVQRTAHVRAVDAVSLSVSTGEIVAVTGIEGNGQRELAEAIVGLRHADSGSLRLNGADISKATIHRRRVLGLGYVPEDRVGVGICATMSVADNVAGATCRSKRLSRLGLRNRKGTARLATTVVDKYRVMCGSIAEPISTLSGGNAQKIVVGREIERDTRLLVAVQPTQGLDIGSTSRIWEEMRALRDRGHAVLLVSTDFTEVCGLADRAVVMKSGKVAAEVPQAGLTEENIGRAAL